MKKMTFKDFILTDKDTILNWLGLCPFLYCHCARKTHLASKVLNTMCRLPVLSLCLFNWLLTTVFWRIMSRQIKKIIPIFPCNFGKTFKLWSQSILQVESPNFGPYLVFHLSFFFFFGYLPEFNHTYGIKNLHTWVKAFITKLVSYSHFINSLGSTKWQLSPNQACHAKRWALYHIPY